MGKMRKSAAGADVVAGLLRSAFRRTGARPELRDELIRASLNILAERLNAGGKSATRFQESGVMQHVRNEISPTAESSIRRAPGATQRVNQLNRNEEKSSESVETERARARLGRQEG